MIVSGGHTHVYRFADAISPDFLGGTIDDAAGEAFDKVATMLGLGFPGGPQLARLAETGNPRQYTFPRSFLKDDQITFSFSGLKTAVRYELAGYGAVDFSTLKIPPEKAADVAASFQAAVVDVLVAKARLAMRQTGLQRLCVGGGVAANRLFREQLESAAREDDFELLVAPPELCTDNAVMGAIAFEKFHRQQFEPQTLDIEPGLVR
jgi:N6-L-threonylcarbamoyladenine synthase